MPTAREKKARPALFIRRVRGMGRGVFAGRAFRTGEVIEVCPVLVLPAGTAEASLGPLASYVFKWPADRLAVALGYGSLYNHSGDPNADFDLRPARSQLVFKAVRPVAAGEQIFIDYGWTAEDYAQFKGAA